MKLSESATSWVVVLMAMSSLLSMIGMLKIDQIIHSDLYRYGLQFSYAWAIPYWNIAHFVFAMGWLNIIAAISVHLYSLAFKRKEVEQLVTEVERELRGTKTAQTEKTEEKREQEPKPPEVAMKLIEVTENQAKEASISPPESGTQESKEEKQTVVSDAQSNEEPAVKRTEEIEEQEQAESVTTTESKTEPVSSTEDSTESDSEQEESKETSPQPQEENKETPTITGL